MSVNTIKEYIRYYIVLVMSVLAAFVPNIGCYLCRRMSEIRLCRFKRTIIIMIDNRKKHKILSYISVLTVIGSRMCTTSAVCGIRGVQQGSLLRRTSLQIPVKETFLRRSAVSSANSSSGNVYLTPSYDFACNLASLGVSCGVVSKLHLRG